MPEGPRKYTDEQLVRGVAISETMRQLLIFLGLAPYGGNYETVRRRIQKLGLEAPPAPAYVKGGALVPVLMTT